MRFLKALQKVESGETTEAEVSNGGNSDGNATDRSKLPELLGRSDLKIGGVGSTIRKRAEAHAHAATAQTTATVDERTAIDEHKPAATGAVFHQFAVDPAAVNPHLVAITQPQSAYCEEYRSLRTQVIHKSQERHLQAIVVASVGPAEGKSVTALNLAWLLAQTEGISALIIDSDLRMPSLNDYLGIGTQIGLSSILDRESTLESSIIQLQPSGLCLLPGGHSRGDVAELLSGSKFRDILDEARGMFDYVIIDAPPLAVFTDAAVLINLADAALLVVRANQTKYSDIARVLESIPRKRLLGTILNQSEESLALSGYYGYSSYHKLLAD